MPKIIFYLFCAAALASFSVSCGDSGDSAAELASVEEFPPALTDAICARIFSCWVPDEIPAAIERDDFSSEEGCRDRLRLEIAPRFDDAPAAVAERLRIYSPAKARTCLDEIQIAACDRELLQIEGVGASCGQIFEGQVEEGNLCYGYVDCREGYCVPDGPYSGETTQMLPPRRCQLNPY